MQNDRFIKNNQEYKQHHQRNTFSQSSHGNRKNSSSSSKSQTKKYERSRSRSKERYNQGTKAGYQSHFKSPQKKYRIIVPTLDGPLVSYRVFMENQPENLDRDRAENLYNKYKNDWETKQNDIFYSEHRLEQWFQEKYDPYQCLKLKEEKKNCSKDNALRFNQQFQNGLFDKLNLEVTSQEIESSQQSQQNQMNQIDQEDNQGDQIRQTQQIEIYFDGNQKQLFDTTYYFTENSEKFKNTLFGFDPNYQTLFIKSIPKNISRWDIKQIFKNLPGFIYLSLSDPLKSNEFNRFGWILFDTEENFQKASQSLSQLIIQNYAFTIVKSKQPQKSFKVASKLDDERIQVDIQTSKQLIQVLDKEQSITDNPLFLDNQRSNLQQLDLQIIYLRKVHSYCYYCATDYFDERMLASKCGPGHLRLKIDQEDGIVKVPDWHNKMVQQNISRINTPKQKIDSSHVDEKILKLIDDILTQQAQEKYYDNKWPCLCCEKMFAACSYVIRHVSSKHEDFVQKEKNKIIEQLTLKNYSDDPQKIFQGYQQQDHRGGYYRQNNFVRRGGYQNNRNNQNYHHNNNNNNNQNYNNNNNGQRYQHRNYQNNDRHRQQRDFDKNQQNMMEKNPNLINYNEI